MRKLLVLCLLFFSIEWAFGQQKMNGDGTSWKVSDAMQVGYISGYIQGYKTGTLDAAALVYAKTPSTMPSLSPEHRKEMLDRAAKAKVRLEAFDSNGTLGQLATTMDTFYSDFRNTPVCWQDALLFSNASLAGYAPTEQELEMVRKADAKNGCN
jgi:hypothetical protein